MTTAARVPAAFVGHGSPMNALESNRFTSAWRELGAKLPRPRAVLSISAHWYLAGLCDAAGEPARAFVEGGSMGSITMTGYLLGEGIGTITA